MAEPFYTAGARIEKVKRTHRRAYLDKCPTSRSLEGAIDVTWTADVEEVADR